VQSSFGAEMKLEKAIGTAEYANHAKAERVCREDAYTLRLNTKPHAQDLG
jgi:hypothetical protein